MPNNNSLYGSTTTTGTVSNSNYTTLYSDGTGTVASNNLVVPGTLTVNGCAILTNCTTFNLLPTTATSINFGLAATALSIGATTGVTTINNQLATANYTFPVAYGTAGQILTTNGAGVLSFSSATGIGKTYDIDATTTTGGANFNLNSNLPSTDTIKFANGSNVTVVATNPNTITISATDTNTTYNIDASTIVGGANLNLTGSDSSIDSVAYKGAGATTVTRTDANTITISSTDANTTYTIDASSTTGGANFNLVGSDLTTDTIKFSGSGATTVTQTNPNEITISSVNTNTTYDFNASSTTGGVNLNLVGSDSTTDTVKLSNGTGVTVSYVSGTEASIAIGQSVATTVTPQFAGITLNGATSGSSTFAAPATGSTLSYVLPGTAGAASTVLTNDGSGNLSWALPGGGGSTFGNITVGIVTDNTISTTTGNLILDAASNIVQIDADQLFIPFNSNINMEGNYLIDSASVTTSTTTPNQVLANMLASATRSAKFVVQVTSGTAYQVVEILAIHDGTTATITVYGDVRTGANLSAFDADVSGVNFRLLVTPVNAVTTYRAAITRMFV